MSKKTGFRKILLTLALIALTPAISYAAGVNVNLTADSMHYNPFNGVITARGSVHLTRPDGELFGDVGYGSSDGREFAIEGSVRGNFTSDDVSITCHHLNLSSLGTAPVRREITASGDVVLTRGADRISARTLTWELESEKYTARGNVLAKFEAYAVDADEAGRDDADFWAKGVRRYEDIQRDFSLSANTVDGRIKDGRISEMVASGSVEMNAKDDRGTPSRITGNKGVFSVARGTLVVSGNAIVNQEGRRLQAGNIVYHLETGRIEALDRPTLVIEMPE